MLSCKIANTELFLGTENNIAQCCMQGRGWEAPDWNDITDLAEWHKTFEPFNAIRNDLANGIQNDHCKRCWNLENNGLQSARKDPVDDEIAIKKIEVRFSNKCNLQCKMCDVNSSDQIKNVVTKLKDQGISNHFTLQHELYVDFKNKNKILELVLTLNDLEIIQFAGGEPFVMPEVEWFIDELITRDKTNVTIYFITNVTSVKPKLMEKLKKFKHVYFICSIDGIEETLEFQRYPAKWSTIEKNFRALHKLSTDNDNIGIRVLPCITQLNLLGMPKFLEWLKQFDDISIGCNVLKDSSFLEYKLVPIKHRQEFIDIVQSMDISWLPEVDQPAYRKFFNEGCNLERNITDTEREYLTDFVKVWDMNPGLKTKDICPWIPELIVK